MATVPPPGKIACPHCQGLIKAPAIAAGSAVNCPKCGKAFRLGEETVTADQGPQSKVQSHVPRDGGRVLVEGQRTKDEGRKIAPGVPQPPPLPVANRQSQIPNSGSPPAAASPKKPDNLVDPNLLPPPPPRVKEKLKEVPVVCHLCGTRIYVKIEKIGQEVKCPDCHTRNLVVGPKAEGAAKTKGPTLDGVEEMGMSEVVQRPKYRPLQSARGEYEVLSALDPATIEQRLTVPGQKPRKKRLVAAPAEDQSGEADEEHGELSLAPPVERAEAARDPRTVLPQPQLDDEDPLYDGRYDDGLIGDGVDPRQPDAWKKAPLVYGIVEFLFFASTLLRLAAFSCGLAAVGAMISMNLQLLKSDTGPAQIMGLMIMRGAIPVAAMWLMAFAAAFHTITEATGNGEVEVTSWPDWNWYEWFAGVGHLLIAVFACAVPGGLIAAATLAASLENPAMAIFGIASPIVISLLILFPFVYFSMLAENSMLTLFSPYVWRSLTFAAPAWAYFYMYSIALTILGTCAVAMLIANNMVVMFVGAIASVTLFFLYARLLGRLMWVAGQRESK